MSTQATNNTKEQELQSIIWDLIEDYKTDNEDNNFGLSYDEVIPTFFDDYLKSQKAQEQGVVVLKDGISDLIREDRYYRDCNFIHCSSAKVDFKGQEFLATFSQEYYATDEYTELLELDLHSLTPMEEVRARKQRWLDEFNSLCDEQKYLTLSRFGFN